MRILISGGEKSINIVNGIKSKFTASGDEFIVIPYIEDIPALYAKGDTFDKALITMESVTRDNAINTEAQIRQRINAFALDASKRVKKSLYVFLSPIGEIANIMQEETLLIERYTAVLLKARPYSVQFFVEILVKDVAQIPDGLIYKPSLIGVEQRIDTSLDVDDIEVEPQVVVHDNNGFDDAFDNFGSDEFDGIDDIDDIDDIDEDFGLDDGFGDTLEFSNDEQFGNEPNFDNDEQFGNEPNFDNDEQFGNELNFDNDEQFGNELNFDNDGEFSGDNFGDTLEFDNADAPDNEGEQELFEVGTDFNNESTVQIDDELFNGNNNSTDDFPFSDNDAFGILEDGGEQEPFEVGTDFNNESTVQINDEQIDDIDQSIYDVVDEQCYDDNAIEFNEVSGEAQNIGFDDTNEHMNSQDNTSYSNIDDEYSGSQDKFKMAYDNNSNSNNENHNANMNENPSDDFISDTEDDFDDYIENDNQTDFYDENNANEFNGDAFGENGSSAFNENFGENELYDEQYNQPSDYENNSGLNDLSAVTTSIAIEEVSRAVGNRGDGGMRISSNRGGSDGRRNSQPQNQQQTQQAMNSDYIPGFDDDFDYDDIDNQQNQNQNQGEFDDYGQTTGYDDYNQDDFGQDAYEQVNMSQQSPADNTGLTGEELSDFSDEAYNDQVQNPMNQAGQIEQPQEQKKGLFGGVFRRGKRGNTSSTANTVPAGQVQNGVGNGLGGEYNTAVNNQNVNTAGTSGQILDGKGKPVNINKIRDRLKPFAARGTAIAVTGFGGSGTSTIAYGLANILCQLGYNILLVDFDVNGRTQSYITRSCYDAVEPESANIMAAVNSTTGIDRQLSVVKEGFHLLTMGLGADVKPIEEMIKKEKLNRFFNTVKNKHQFVIYDLPFEYATGYCSEITYNSDNVVLVADSSTWGLGKMMINVCNIVSEDMQDTIFNRGQVVFNKYRNMKKLFGYNFRNAYDMLGILDRQVVDLVGDVGLHFSNMRVSGIIHDDPAVEDTYFTENSYSDTRKGQNIFLELAQNVILNK